MQQYSHSWKARIKPILYIYGGGEGEQKPGQVSLRNQHFPSACSSELNLNFAALATSTKSMCGCLHACFGEYEPSIQLLSLGKYVQVSKTQKKSLSLKNQPGFSARGGTEGSSSADVHPSRLGNGQTSLQLGLVVGSLQQRTSVPAGMLACHLTDLVWTANNQQPENLPRIQDFQAQWFPCAKAWWGHSRSLCELFLLGLFCFE